MAARAAESTSAGRRAECRGCLRILRLLEESSGGPGNAGIPSCCMQLAKLWEAAGRWGDPRARDVRASVRGCGRRTLVLLREGTRLLVGWLTGGGGTRGLNAFQGV